VNWTEPSGDTGAWMRVFMAINPSPGIVAALRKLQRHLQQELPGDDIRWVPADQIHLTLRFIGDLDPQRLEPLIAAMDEACRPVSPLHLGVGGLGVFPEGPHPRIIWTGLTGDLATLQQLRTSVDAVCGTLGIRREEHEFRPHLTLARVKRLEPDGFTRLAGLIDAPEWRSLGEWLVDRAELIQSILTPKGATYKPLETFSLGPASDS
jgi:2'-5' RNA ligase